MPSSDVIHVHRLATQFSLISVGMENSTWREMAGAGVPWREMAGAGVPWREMAGAGVPCLVGRPTTEAGTAELCCDALIMGWLIEGLAPWPARGTVILESCGVLSRSVAAVLATLVTFLGAAGGKLWLAATAVVVAAAMLWLTAVPTLAGAPWGPGDPWGAGAPWGVLCPAAICPALRRMLSCCLTLATPCWSPASWYSLYCCTSCSARPLGFMLALGLGLAAVSWAGAGRVMGGVWPVGGVSGDKCVVVPTPVRCGMERALGFWAEDETGNVAWGCARELFGLCARLVKVVMEGLEARTEVAGSRGTEPVKWLLGRTAATPELGFTSCGERNPDGTVGGAVLPCCRKEWFNSLEVLC